MQNQLHWAIHGETAAEVIYHRADSEKQNMGLQTWKDAPSGKIQRFDVTVAKNYLTEQELSAMARICLLYTSANDRGTTVIVVTHNHEIVNAMQKRVVTMKQGSIVSDEKKGGYV